jgi:hypothetical protein
VSRNLLIDGLIRQMMVTVAELATAGGVRTPLGHLAGEVFVSLATELQEHGLGRKVIADMFGLTLRAYHAKMRRLSESRTDRGHSLWSAILDFVAQRRTVSRAEVEKRFARDDAASVAGILADLAKSRLLFRMGEGADTVYRAATPEDLPTTDRAAVTDSFVWLEVYRSGGMTLAELAGQLALPEGEVAESLERLTAAERVSREDGRWTSRQMVIPYEDAEGWEAAVLDHFQVVATTIAVKARARRATMADHVGGSTFHFDLRDDHPLRDEVLSLLARTRTEAAALRRRVDEASGQREPEYRVSFYLGQVVIADDDGEEVNS